MFFRREKAREFSFDDRLEALTSRGLAVGRKGSGKAVAMRKGCAAVLVQKDQGVEIESAGVIIGHEIGELTHGGYQMFFVTPSGVKTAALAEQLKELHEFTEDIKEGLGQESLYNTSLGTTNQKHLYDRVRGRDPKAAAHSKH